MPTRLAVACVVWSLLPAGALRAQQAVFLPNGRAQVVGGHGKRTCELHRSEGVDVVTDGDAIGIDSTYRAALREGIIDHLHAEESQHARQAQLQASLRRDGSLIRVTFVSHSKDPGFDESAQTAISEAALAHALPAFPASYQPDSLTLSAYFGRKSSAPAAYIEQWRFCPAWPFADNPQPPYPVEEYKHSINGEVEAQFVVDTLGKVQTPTYKVLHASSPAFAASVEQLLPDLRFAPAEVRGRKVAQVTQQLFRFDVERIAKP